MTHNLLTTNFENEDTTSFRTTMKDDPTDNVP